MEILRLWSWKVVGLCYVSLLNSTFNMLVTLTIGILVIFVCRYFFFTALVVNCMYGGFCVKLVWHGVECRHVECWRPGGGNTITVQIVAFFYTFSFYLNCMASLLRCRAVYMVLLSAAKSSWMRMMKFMTLCAILFVWDG